MRTLALIALLAGCGGGGAEEAPEEDALTVVVDDRAYTLDADAYRFCHEPGAQADEAAAWCDVLAQVPPERCPGLRATCDGAEPTALDERLPGCLGLPPLGPGGAPAGAPELPETPDIEPPDLPMACDPPADPAGWLVLVLQWVGAVLVALVVLVAIRLVVWAVRRPSGPDAAAEPVEDVVLSAIVAGPDLPEAPSADLLAAAERAERSGRYEEAVLLARAAVLRRLGEAGRVRLHRARTDREYLRELRRDGAVHGPLGVVLRAVEALRWGGGAVEPGRAADVLSAARKLVAALGVATALLLFTGAAGDERYGVTGDAAIADLLRASGYPVTWRLRALSSVDEDVSVVIVDLSGVQPDEAAWAALRAWVGRGHLLIVGGAAEGPFPELGEAAAGEDLAMTAALGLPVPALPGGPVRLWPAPAATPLVVVDPGGAAAAARLPLGDGFVVALADSRLLYNAALVVPANEALLVGLIDAHLGAPLPLDRAEVEVQLALVSAGGADGPIGAMANANLLPFVLQLLATVALGALWLGWPLSPLRDPPAADDRARFADHVEALGLRLRRARASGWARATHARWALGRYGAAGLAAAAERHGRTPAQAAAWAAGVQRSADSPRTTPDDLDALEDLCKTLRRD